MTPTEALAAALGVAGIAVENVASIGAADQWLPDYQTAAAVLDALPPGWRFIGPDEGESGRATRLPAYRRPRAAPSARAVLITEAAIRARDLIAYYLWSEDDSGDENHLEAAYEALRAVLGPSTEESVGTTLVAIQGAHDEPAETPE